MIFWWFWKRVFAPWFWSRFGFSLVRISHSPLCDECCCCWCKSRLCSHLLSLEYSTLHYAAPSEVCTVDLHYFFFFCFAQAHNSTAHSLLLCGVTQPAAVLLFLRHMIGVVVVAVVMNHDVPMCIKYNLTRRCIAPSSEPLESVLLFSYGKGWLISLKGFAEWA